MDTHVNKKPDLIRLAIALLDKQDGMEVTEYDMLKTVLLNEGGQDIKELIDNVELVSHRAFLNETWVEENMARFE